MLFHGDTFNYLPTRADLKAESIVLVRVILIMATFRSVAYAAAHSGSNAIFRPALDECHREVLAEGSCLYWPSYEPVAEVFANRESKVAVTSRDQSSILS